MWSAVPIIPASEEARAHMLLGEGSSQSSSNATLSQLKHVLWACAHQSAQASSTSVLAALGQG